MTQRTFTITHFTVRMLALAMASIQLVACAPEQKHPNVVLVVMDTLRADRLPIYGFSCQTAPFLSRLADNGVQASGKWSRRSDHRADIRMTGLLSPHRPD